MRTGPGPLGTARLQSNGPSAGDLESVLASSPMGPACPTVCPAAWQATRVQRRSTSLQLLNSMPGRRILPAAA